MKLLNLFWFVDYTGEVNVVVAGEELVQPEFKIVTLSARRKSDGRPGPGARHACLRESAIVTAM